MMRRDVSSTPIGRTPGHLSMAMSLLARSGATPSGLTCSVQSLLATKARQLQRSSDAGPKDVHRRLHEYASRPEGPAEP